MLRGARECGHAVAVGVDPVGFLERMGGEAVRLEQVRDDDERARTVLDAGRKTAGVIGVEPEHFGLVHRDPAVDEISVPLAHEARVAHEMGKVLRVFPAAERGEPGRVGEVVERDQRRDPANPASFEHGAVVSERGLIVPPHLGLDAAPFDREAIGVQAEPADEVEILLPSLPAQTGRSRAGSVRDLSGNRFPGPPIVPVVPAFGLVRRRGGAPKKPIRTARRGARLLSARSRGGNVCGHVLL